MIGQNHSASMEMVERLYSGLSTFQDLRAKYRSRANRTDAPPATVTTAPPAAPTASPPGVATSVATDVTSTPANGQVIAFVSVQGRVLPIFADPSGFPGATAHATASATAPPAADVTAPPATDVSSPPAANTKPPASATSGPVTPSAPPTPTSAQPVQENPAPRTPHVSATIALDPPKPPAVIRTKDRTEAHEQILADHRTMLGEQMRAAEERSAAVLRDVLADHRQQFAELLTQHRTELHGASVARAEDAQATADLRALVAEQTRVMQEAHVQLSERTAEQSRVLQEAHVQLSEQTANLNEAIGSLGESVYRLTIAYFAPTSAPSSGPTQSAASVDTDDKTDTAASPASDPGLKPLREAPQSIHSILADLDLTASTPTPRQLKAQEDASNQRRMHEDLEHYDDEFIADVVDPDDAALTNSEELKGSSRCLPPTT